ncbi:hypothetical protein [Litorisediminicola beolgyonensis]|uniref:Peptidase M48 domain-containing protein n=1 Tax=Litorisediminicola beolgyonensis TaxID=1173614 RepID=A0ABW3ZML6_9RHOB
MTALTEYQRLEATGLWRPAPGEQRREVIVSLGDATLTLSDLNERALTHWSLAALERGSARGTLPASFHPDGDPGETLEIGEDGVEMIDALDRIIRAVDRRRPHPGKLRLWIGLGLAAAVTLAAIFWLPGALLDTALRVVPQAQRSDIGEALLDRIARVSGQPCASPEAREPLRRLATRLLGPGRANDLVVLRDGVETTAHLPGGTILIGRAVVEDPQDPDVTAGYILAEALRAESGAPLRALLSEAGLWSSLTLLTTGSLPGSALDRYAERVLTQPPAPVQPSRLLAAFDKAELRSTPYAYALDVTGETVLGLIEADPRAVSGSREVLPDADWLRLQAICGG